MCLCFLIAELHRYQLRAYLFQARNVFAGDDSGFSGTWLCFSDFGIWPTNLNADKTLTLKLEDPYAFVVLGNASAKTRIIEETLNPQWDQTLILDRILLPGEPDRVWEMLPEIVIEIFDFDEIVRFPRAARAHVLFTTWFYTAIDWSWARERAINDESSVDVALVIGIWSCSQVAPVRLAGLWRLPRTRDRAPRTHRARP